VETGVKEVVVPTLVFFVTFPSAQEKKKTSNTGGKLEMSQKLWLIL
jgi:hypothetical protein